MKKICFVATVPDVVYSFLRGHIGTSAKKWPVTIITHPRNADLLSDLDATIIPIGIERKVSLWRDLSAVVRLAILFRRERFDLVHSIMPKAGLLAMLAGWLAGVPNRIHTFTGQVWATKRGWKRSAFKMFDRLIVLFATRILVDSPSQRDFLVSEGVLAKGKGIVIGHGSICGIDAHQFHPDIQVKNEVRSELNIGLDQIAILFLGRLNRDKGVLDLAAAFADIASLRNDVVLLLVGAEEDVSFTRFQEICGIYANRLRRIDFTPYPERYMVATDIFCLPSYREGFGQVIIEAAACGVPAVASRIYGIIDAVDEGSTGLLFPAGDIDALERALLKMINEPALREKMGELARIRVFKYFDSEVITAQQIQIYEEVLTRSTSDN